MTQENAQPEEDNAAAPVDDMQALAAAFREFSRTSEIMEESYRRLEQRIHDMDQELAAKNRELALQSDYLNSILDSMSDGVIAVNVDGTVTAFNGAAAHVLGYDSHEVIGRPFRDVFHREFTSPPGRSVMELRTSGGDVVTVSESDRPMEDRDGRRIGMVKVFQDLTELRALRKQVRRKERLAAVGEMAATVAHEIRNPLGGIRGFAALLARDLEGQEAPLRLVNKILTGARDLERVVNELLEYTRPVELHLRTVNASELVDAAAGFVEPNGVNIRNSVDPSAEVMADPDRMRQVFLNLLINAVQSMEPGGEVCVELEFVDEMAVFCFSDSGCGMNREQLEQIFSPFYTTKEKGTGLGLAVASKLVEIHGGEIQAESTPGRGSIFRVRLPRQA
jgi:PAS domain S-box-containing protein